MILDIIYVIIGIALLVAGGEFMVRGASSLARSFGISSLVIGLTVVAFGTSAPELVVNVRAALGGNGDMSLGNVLGSNLANIGLILGIAAMIRPLAIKALVVRREIPMMLVATAAVFVMAVIRFPGEPEIPGFTRIDGLVLFGLFAVFLGYTARDVIKGHSANAVIGPLEEEVEERRHSTLVSLGMTAGGMAALLFGGWLTVESAENIAVALEVPEFIIGLTVLAVGTSLPELVTALVAVRRGQTDIAVGNVVGSNIFNLLFVLSTTLTIAPFSLPADAIVDLAAVFLISALLLPFAITSKLRIVRWEGAVLLLMYFGFVAWRTKELAGG